MSSIIYQSKGAAGEYADGGLSCNLAIGCTHNCKYCYGPKTTRNDAYMDGPVIKRDALERIERDGRRLHKEGFKERVFFSFTTDPFCTKEMSVLTLDAIEILGDLGIRSRVLTKAGMYVVTNRSTHIFKKYETSFGQTIVFEDDALRQRFEPGGAMILSRIGALKLFATSKKVETWVSVEPIIYGTEAMKVAAIVAGVCDFVWFGAMGHNSMAELIDWPVFVDEIRTVLRNTGTRPRFKESITKHL